MSNTPAELLGIAEELQVENASAMRKQELMFAILKSLATRKQDPPSALQSNELVLNQLLDLFVKGADGTYNKKADFDYLAYVIADLSKHPEIRQFFVEKQDYDDVHKTTNEIV